MRRSVDPRTLSLPFPARELSPRTEFSEPRLWIRRLYLWHEFGGEPVREIEFRRGVNIITSPGGSSPTRVSTGHAAGKTLLCRQIRFCLGEDSFADPDDTSAIRARFPLGGVAAQIRLCGESWVVRRGFGARADHRAKRGARVEELWDEAHRDSFDQFRAQLRPLAFDDAQQTLLRAFEDVEEPWQYVLAWLTRDQECRLDGLAHWRHQDSSSQSPVRGVGAETRVNVLRVALGLYSEEATAARKRVTDANSAVSAAESSARRSDERVRVLRTELARGLALDEARIWPPTLALLQDEAGGRAAHFQQLANLVDDRIRSLATTEMSPAQRADEDALEAAMADLAEVTQRTESAADELKRASENLEFLSKKYTDAWAALRLAKHPTCPFDDTRIDVEAARFVCPLPRLPNADVARELAEGTEARQQRLADAVARQREELAALRRSEATLKATVARLGRAIAAHEQARAERDAIRQAAWSTKTTLARLVEAVDELEAARAEEKRARATQKSMLDLKNLQLDSYPTAHLTTWFDELVKRVVSAEAHGEVTLDGNGLHATIQWRGRRRSVALNSLRLVLFDIAAMLCAVEGTSSAPAFLLHDSPREGDLDTWTYARLFEAVFALDPNEDSAPFQYIVTTTTEPPEGPIRARVRQVLSAESDTDRFFRVDL